MDNEIAEKYLAKRMALASGSTQQDKNKYMLVIGGTALLMVFALIMTN